MTKDEALKLALEALENNRQTHHYCEDTWYSCPKHEDGCANDAEGDECNCGADKANAEIDATITAIKEALMSDTDGAQPAVTESHKQEPVAKVVSTAPERIWLDLGFDPSDEDEISFDDLIDATWSHDNATGYGIEYVRADTTPPQRKPLTDEEFRAILRSLSRQQGWDGDGWDLALKEAIEAAHGIKGEA